MTWQSWARHADLDMECWPINDDLPSWSEDDADEACRRMLRYRQAKWEYFEDRSTAADDQNKKLKEDIKARNSAIILQHKRLEDNKKVFVTYI
ncbi:hypothetical protein LTR70_007632 [Exophiala xenobiotica]|uniref:Uncharacterized protein n=1 Tax=Lithohypha guttulata TaxID=1690604 RepID=A0ABR0K3W3_9EURO|nr:hypothetical protein LTR24_007164 [Lithohypha guttulata]KAK5313446.1 hypothetical protein LTR70_007632 [Exophiala xenobiotica]